MASLAEQFANLRMVPSSRTTMEGDVSKGLDSVETGELEKQLTGEAVAGPDKIVVIWLKVHGIRLQREELNYAELPELLTFSRPANICPLFEPDTDKVMSTFETARSRRNIHDVLSFMESRAPSEMAKSRAAAAELVRQTMDSDNFRPTFEGRERAYRYAPGGYIVRKPDYDHGLESDRDVSSMYASGIFILASTFNQRDLLVPVQGLTEHFMVDDYSAEEKLQSYNLLNIPVLQELSNRVTGHAFALEGDTEVDKVLGIDQYKRSRISQFIQFFKKLGADKVFVIDDTCQSGAFREGADDKEKMAAASVSGAQQSVPTGAPISPTRMRKSTSDKPFGDYGGTIKRKKSRKRKSKRNRSRRFHKK